MKMPTFDSMMNPLLEALHILGGSGSIDEINAKVFELLNLPEEILEVTQAKSRNVNKSLSLIIRDVFPIFGYKYAPITPELLIYRFGEELGISLLKQKLAISTIRIASKRGLNWFGKDPKGLAAASIYLAVRDTDEHRTQTEISTVSRITEVTLRTRSKQIFSHLP